MPITIPTKGTEITVVGFGQPVADQVNQNTIDVAALKAPHVIAGKQQNITQNNLTAGVWTNVTGMSLTFTAKANWLYEVGWQSNLNNTVNGLGVWYAVGLGLDGANAARFVMSGVGSHSAPGYGNTIVSKQFCSAKLGGVLTAGSHTFQLMVTCTGAAFNVEAGAPSYLYVADWGPDT